MTDPDIQLGRTILVREAVASVALSHGSHCDCTICRAWDGDPDAIERVFVAVFSPDRE
jgi:hypothetical protein